MTSLGEGIFDAEKDALAELRAEIERRDEMLRESNVVAEEWRTRYQSIAPLMAPARRLLDQMAVDRGSDPLSASATDLAQQIMNEIGQPVVEEPALGDDLKAEIEVLQAKRGETLGYLVWHEERGSIGPIWSTAERARKFLETAIDNLTTDRCELYRVVVVSGFPTVKS